jgi:hypothetical protein
MTVVKFGEGRAVARRHPLEQLQIRIDLILLVDWLVHAVDKISPTDRGLAANGRPAQHKNRLCTKAHIKPAAALQVGIFK